MRLDKFLAHTGFGSRKEVKQLLSNGWVSVNDKVVKKVISIDEQNDIVKVGEEVVQYEAFSYLLLNKPEGIISATEDNYHETVIDWIGPELSHLNLFPVGRLDIDTTGLLLLTNNGQLSHQLLSPKRHVAKRYYAEIDGVVTEEMVVKFEKGLHLGDFTTLPAKLEILHVNPDTYQSRIEVEIQEGKFHQVKRMFEKVGCTVVRLHRLSMGPLVLPEDLAVGEFRPLNDEERKSLAPYGLK
ncbi:pseudouridine synthase [Tuanshanicoccus lijuaniae]|uniref:pseudouridine synthase n=1 Tax=Aerococcaceae bacterium zg-1292 TaxID=2774330 RepID=UPI001BD82057|nr:rRNA pseudouridine synthase [Aerococcaceae bacterium zg-A91]MBS4458672.1 rRNA pseudouridine synthase [Aerococcaceae bacterium zg-BR33]